MATRSASDANQHAPSQSQSRFAWTESDKNTLRQMWADKRTSSEIAAKLGQVSRNAVMGMVNRLGLMGRGGSRDRVPTRAQAIRFVEEIFDEPYAFSKAGHFHALIAISSVMCGRDAECLARFTSNSLRNVTDALAQFHELGIWVEGDPHPPSWTRQTTGNIALAMDCLVASRHITRRLTTQGEWEYRATRDE